MFGNWTPGEVQAARSGDPAKGAFVVLNCAACHGDHGVSPASWIPSLAGMRADALTKQLIDYSSRHRTWPVMNAIASALIHRSDERCRRLLQQAQSAGSGGGPGFARRRPGAAINRFPQSVWSTPAIPPGVSRHAPRATGSTEPRSRRQSWRANMRAKSSGNWTGFEPANAAMTKASRCG